MLLQATGPLNVFNAEREVEARGKPKEEERDVSQASPCLFFVTHEPAQLSPSPLFRRPPRGKLDVSTTVKSVGIQLACASAWIIGWLLEWTFSITRHVLPTLSASCGFVLFFVRCCSSERCVILDAVTAKTEMTLKRWRQGEERR